MAIQKGNKYLFLMLIALSFFSCRDQVQKRIDNILLFSTKGMISRYEKNEQWDGFIGDGYKIESFLITDASLIDSIRLKYREYDSTWVKEHFSSCEMYNFLANTSGFYKQTFSENQIEYVIIDTTQMRLLYYTIIY